MKKEGLFNEITGLSSEWGDSTEETTRHVSPSLLTRRRSSVASLRHRTLNQAKSAQMRDDVTEISCSDSLVSLLLPKSHPSAYQGPSRNDIFAIGNGHDNLSIQRVRTRRIHNGKVHTLGPRFSLVSSPLTIRWLYRLTSTSAYALRHETCADNYCEVCFVAQHRKGSRKRQMGINYTHANSEWGGSCEAERK